jgi:LacI family transcriptional regulator
MNTIKDVARAAGVSVATVSRVFNDTARVTADTRDRVVEAAGRLGYSAHGAARSLITSRTSTIGVLLPDLHGEFFSEIIRGIDQAAQRHGYHLLVSSSHNNRSELDAAVRAMRGRVDGLIVMAPTTDMREFVEGIAARFPLVLLGDAAVAGDFHSLGVANREGAIEMIRHLLRLGHRRIAMVRGPEGNHDAAERHRGYAAALAEAGIPRNRTLELPGDFTESSGYAAAERLIRRRTRPTAIFAANDATAIGVLSALHDRGVSVPEDIAVAGFDDIPTARYITPSLTTVRVDISGLGARAATRLLQAVANGDARGASRDVVPATLVIRRSCGGGVPPVASRRRGRPSQR